MNCVLPVAISARYVLPVWAQCIIVFGPLVVFCIALVISFWKIDHTDWYPGSGKWD